MASARARTATADQTDHDVRPDGLDEPPLRPLVALLAADVLALHVNVPSPDALEVDLVADGEPVALEQHTIAHNLPSSDSTGRLVVARLAAGPIGADATLAVRAGGRELVLGPAALGKLSVDLRRLLRERLAALTAAERDAVLALLVEVAGGGSADPIGLSTSMALTREGLREPAPSCVVSRDEPQGLHFDAVLALTDRAFYVRGWALDRQATLTRLTVVSPEGARAELLPGAHRIPRPDVDSFYEHPRDCASEDIGFIAHVELPAPSHARAGWVLEMENALGVRHEVNGPIVSSDPLLARAAILADLHKERHCDTPLMDHVEPAVKSIQDRIDERTEIAEVVQLGEPPTDPEASIVVPLYGRIDFLEQQLAQFVHDPEIRASDLIYVLDSPELAPALLDAAAQLFDLYDVPFRVAILSQNGGYSVANNRGASLARGRLLLLLNSDVLPDRPGWLSRMVAFYDAQERIGALGPKLLFEDDTLQHAGICFRQPPGSGAWENQHFFKGLHRDLPTANVARPVPAVTGACLMVERALFEQLGGLRGMYVQGDYEDTDMCLRLREIGRDTWYLPEVELYHLEGQSYALEARHATSRYNVWLHSRLWNDEIGRVMEECGSAPSPAPVR
jgi:GT2 family glycosyltransferase